MDSNISIGNSTAQLPELYEIPAPSMTLNFGVMLVFWALLSFITEGEFKDSVSDIELSGLPRKRRANRFFYMLQTHDGLKTVSRDEAEKIKSRQPERLFSVWAMDAEQARKKITEGQGENYLKYQQNLSFAGDLLNCVGWQQVTTKKGDTVSRCFVFAPNCKKKACIKDTEERKEEGWTPRASQKSELSGYYTSCKSYFRNAAGKLKCKKYALICNPDAECAPTKAINPYRDEEIEFSDKAIKSVARTLADEMNHTIDDTKRLMRIVRKYGGIAPYGKGYLSEEYRGIPTKYKSNEGIKIDELAQELGLNESELVEQINKAEDIRMNLPKGKTRFTVKDMMFDAENYLRQQENEGFAGIKKRRLSIMRNDPDFIQSLGNIIKSPQVTIFSNVKEAEDCKQKRHLGVYEKPQIPKEYKPYKNNKTDQIYFIKDEPYWSKQYKMSFVRALVYDTAYNQPQRLILEDADMPLEIFNKQFTPIDKADREPQLTLFGVRFKADITENQIRSRVYDPKKIVQGTYFTRASTTPGVSYVMGQDDKSGKFITQSIRFDRDKFDKNAAKRWFKNNIKRIQERDLKNPPYPKPYYMSKNFSQALAKRMGNH